MGYTIAKKRDVKKNERAETDELITFEQFYEMISEGVKADLLDGKIIRDSPAVPRHGLINSWLTQLLGLFVEQRGLGKVFIPTTTVRLSEYQAVEPDVFFISNERAHIIGEKYIDGAPDLCIEILSKSSRKHDRGHKFVLYAEHGVKEYWIIDPPLDKVEFFENQNGIWQPIRPDEQGWLHSKVLPGFWLKPEWLAGDLVPVLPLLQKMFKKSR
ncbi:MAG: Uma2 family endonuclease [bacterium]